MKTPERRYPVLQRDMRYADPIVEEPRSSVAFSGADSSINASIELLERTRRKANYVVKIVNDSPHPLICAAMGVRGIKYTALEPPYFWVEPRAASAIMVAVPLRIWSPFKRMFVNMRSQALSYSLEVHVPPSPLLPTIAAFAAVLLLLIASTSAYVQMRPRITAYALPMQALAGTPIRASYDLAGVGTATYAVSDGAQQIAGGTLAFGSGSFEFPATTKAASYSVALAVHGPLGEQSETRTVRTVEPIQTVKTSTLELIRAFEVDDAVVHSGQPIVVRYIGAGLNGSVRLLDTAQIPVLQAPYSSNGISTMRAPKVVQATPYRLELIARSGSASQSASVGITVVPALAGAEASPASLLPNVLSAEQLLQIVPPYVRGGSPIRVQLLQHPAKLRLVLQSARGVPLQSQAVGADQAVIDFNVPPVGVDQTFVIVASFQSGSGDQVILAPFTVHAR
ncbi:MAG: hypothetical protein ABI182_08770 [Candidatus Baltobacteraceae bacterium]